MLDELFDFFGNTSIYLGYLINNSYEIPFKGELNPLIYNVPEFVIKNMNDFLAFR